MLFSLSYVLIFIFNFNLVQLIVPSLFKSMIFSFTIVNSIHIFFAILTVAVSLWF